MTRLSDREEVVLKTIVEQYVNSSEPVGSRYVSKCGPLSLSAASIRNIMSDLEEKGFIFQPHTSSGRVPSDSGYRYYIDRLVTFNPSEHEMTKIFNELTGGGTASVQELFKDMSRRMGLVTKSVGFVISPKINTMFLKHIEFVRLTKHTALCVIVTKTGMIHNLMLDIDETVTESELTRISNYLNANFGNKSLSEVKADLIDEMREEKEHVDELVNKVRRVAKDVFGREMFGQEIIVEGTSNVFDLPEFSDVSKVKELFGMFEEKKFICDILDKCMNEKGVQIFIGSEIGRNEIQDFGLVSKPYSRGGQVIGSLGIIGPKRMSYPKVASVVDYTAQLISTMLDDLSYRLDEE